MTLVAGLYIKLGAPKGGPKMGMLPPPDCLHYIRLHMHGAFSAIPYFKDLSILFRCHCRRIRIYRSLDYPVFFLGDVGRKDVPFCDELMRNLWQSVHKGCGSYLLSKFTRNGCGLGLESEERYGSILPSCRPIHEALLDHWTRG
jgi:hypothetical protein